MTTEPSDLRVLDHSDYDDFSITCSAMASAGVSPLVLDTVSWDRSVDSDPYQPVSDSSYSALTGSAEAGYQSQLTGTESVPSSTVRYRCTVSIPPGHTVSDTSTTTITVQGESLSLFCYSHTYLPLIHLLTHSLTPLPFTPSLPCSLTHNSLPHSLPPSLTHSLTHYLPQALHCQLRCQQELQTSKTRRP